MCVCVRRFKSRRQLGNPLTTPFGRQLFGFSGLDENLKAPQLPWRNLYTCGALVRNWCGSEVPWYRASGGKPMHVKQNARRGTSVHCGNLVVLLALYMAHTTWPASQEEPQRAKKRRAFRGFQPCKVFSAYSLPLDLAKNAQCWDGDVIAEDHHAFLKAWFYAVYKSQAGLQVTQWLPSGCQGHKGKCLGASEAGPGLKDPAQV